MKKTLLWILLLFIGLPLYAQVRINGLISDEKTGEPLTGATVLQKNTKNGTVTDINGNFNMDITLPAVLNVSYVGYKSRELEVKSAGKLLITLLQDNEVLEEVLVVGYGTQKAKDMTAPIATVKGSELVKQIAANPMSALQGKMTGVQVVNTGTPGQGPAVKIRGVGSFGEYGNPLYIVDGVYVDNLDFLSSGDIEDLSVLKDASAAAIYGVRAANGVVLITTKKGKLNMMNVSYDAFAGLQVPTNIMPLANTVQYIELMNEANAKVSGWVPMNSVSYPASVDWYSELTRIAPMHSHALDISGATEKTNYSLGVNYFFQEGIMQAVNDYERINVRGRLDQKVNDWLNIGINNIFTTYTRNDPNNEAFFKAYVNPPVYPVYDENNTDAYPVNFGAPQDYGYGNTYGNPVAIAYFNDNRTYGFKNVMSAFAEFELIKKHLKFKTSYNLDLNSWRSRNFTPEFFVGGSQGLAHASLSKTFGISYKHILDNILTYTNQIDDHAFTLMFGQSTRIERYYGMTGTALNVTHIDEQSLYLSLGSESGVTVKDAGYGYNGVSFFSRGTYNYQDKYLATITFRADGSSKYNDKWGFFPSIGLGWILTSDPLVKDKVNMFNYLKFRASWGLLGNDNVPANSSVILGAIGAASSGIFNDVLIDGIGAQTVLQNFLRWEVVNEFNAGFDFEILNKQVKGEIDYYNRITNDAIFYAPVIAGGGVANLLGNYGKVMNQGVELSLNYNKQISKELSYKVGFNATTIANTVLSLGDQRDYIPGGLVRGTYTTRTAVGHPIGSFYGYETDGVYASEIAALKDPVSQSIKDAGYFKYKDQNGDKVIDETDKVYMGSATPWLLGGIDLGVNYGAWDASVSLQGQIGNKILNAKRMNRDIFTDGNYDLDFYNHRWTESNKSNSYPSAEAYNSSFIQTANDFFIEDGSYLRIQNIQAGYNFKNKGIFKTARVYLSVQRPFTLFSYHGFTPEVTGSNPIDAGLDYATYPMQAIYTAGIKVNL